MDWLHRLDLDAEISRVVSDLVRDPVAIGSPSVYETGRLVSLAPWLDGHYQRIKFLLDNQNPDGSWGGPGHYAVIPTLSAVEAMLTVLDRDNEGGPAHPAALRSASERGLSAAAGQLDAVYRTGPPATAGAAMVIRALVEAINDPQHSTGRLPLPPPAWDGGHLAKLRGGGWRVPLLSHYLELVGPTIIGSPHIQPVDGIVCGSAAATAAWLGPRRPTRPSPSVHALTALQARYAGPVPTFASQVFVAQAWSLSHLAGAGVGRALLSPLRDTLSSSLTTTEGLPGGPGLPADSDTTAVTLYALAQLGVVHSPDPLWPYDTGAHFVTVYPESEPSTSANAHILMTLGSQAARQTPAAARCAAAAARIAAWIRDQQQPDGCWVDKWHASPFYATRSCAIALHLFGGRKYADTVRKATDWVLANQRGDGAWGLWQSTSEETAYAVQTLLHTREDPHAVRAAAGGCRFLLENGLDAHSPPLFQGKDVFSIPNLTRAAVLAALKLASRPSR